MGYNGPLKFKILMDFSLYRNSYRIELQGTKKPAFDSLKMSPESVSINRQSEQVSIILFNGNKSGLYRLLLGSDTFLNSILKHTNRHLKL